MHNLWYKKAMSHHSLDYLYIHYIRHKSFYYHTLKDKSKKHLCNIRLHKDWQCKDLLIYLARYVLHYNLCIDRKNHKKHNRLNSLNLLPHHRDQSLSYHKVRSNNRFYNPRNMDHSRFRKSTESGRFRNRCCNANYQPDK